MQVIHSRGSMRKNLTVRHPEAYMRRCTTARTRPGRFGVLLEPGDHWDTATVTDRPDHHGPTGEPGQAGSSDRVGRTPEPRRTADIPVVG